MHTVRRRTGETFTRSHAHVTLTRIFYTRIIARASHSFLVTACVVADGLKINDGDEEEVVDEEAVFERAPGLRVHVPAIPKLRRAPSVSLSRSPVCHDAHA